MSPSRPTNVGLNDLLSIPEAARWARVDEGRLRRLLTEAGLVHTGLGPARVIVSDVYRLLVGLDRKQAAPPTDTTHPAPPKGKRKRRGTSIGAKAPLPRKSLD